MSTLTIPASLGGSGTTWSDGTDANGMQGPTGYGYKTNLIPMLADILAVGNTALSSVNSLVGQSGGAQWVTGTTYGLGAVVWSPSTFQTFRKKTASSVSNTDPASDATNWVQLTLGNPVPGPFNVTGALSATGNITVGGDILLFTAHAGSAPYLQHSGTLLVIKGGATGTLFLNNAGNTNVLNLSDTGTLTAAGSVVFDTALGSSVTTYGNRESRVLGLSTGGIGVAGAGPELVFGVTDTPTRRFASVSGEVLGTDGTGAYGSVTIAVKASTAATALTKVASFTSAGLALTGAVTLTVGGNSGVITTDAANVVAQRNGTAAQALRAYNTFTDASNGEWGGIDWQTTANTMRIRSQANGTGVVRPIAIDAYAKAGAAVAGDIPVSTFAVVRDTSGATTKLIYNNAGALMSVALT